MNIRIEEQNIRLKISEQELNSLLDSDPLHTKVSILNKTLIIVINPQSNDEDIIPKLITDGLETYLTVLLSPQKIQELSDMGKNRDGLKQQVNDLTISLQVDVRKDSRKKVGQ